jgi:hypothetical protein
MRPQKRSRGRNGGGNPYHNNNPNNRGPRPPHRSQTFDSSGPNVKIRGNAYQVFERYLALAREAQSSGDRIAAENFFQHAEHYFRVMNANGEGFQQRQQQPMMPSDGEGMDGEGDQPEEAQMVQVQHAPPPQPSYGEEQFKGNSDEPMQPVDRNADRNTEPRDDESRLPPFITGRPE